MKTLNLIFVFLLSVFISSTAYNQECKDFLKSKIFNTPVSKSFITYGQPKSENIEVRKTYKFEMVFYGSKEYIMSIATVDDYTPVHIRIINTENNVVLYDNIKFKYKGTANFYMQKTQAVTIEATIIAANKQNPLPKDLRVCLGLKIYGRDYIE